MIRVDEYMFEVMMHMIGYAPQLEECFVDALEAHEIDADLLLKLAEECDRTWGGDGFYTNPLKKAIKKMED